MHTHFACIRREFRSTDWLLSNTNWKKRILRFVPSKFYHSMRSPLFLILIKIRSIKSIAKIVQSELKLLTKLVWLYTAHQSCFWVKKIDKAGLPWSSSHTKIHVCRVSNRVRLIQIHCLGTHRENSNTHPTWKVSRKKRENHTSFSCKCKLGYDKCSASTEQRLLQDLETTKPKFISLVQQAFVQIRSDANWHRVHDYQRKSNGQSRYWTEFGLISIGPDPQPNQHEIFLRCCPLSQGLGRVQIGVSSIEKKQYRIATRDQIFKCHRTKCVVYPGHARADRVVQIQMLIVDIKNWLTWHIYCFSSVALSTV